MIKKKKENKETYRLWLDYDENESIIQDDFDRSDWSGFRKSEIHFDLKGICQKEDSIKQFFKDSIEVDKETYDAKIVYVVIVRYSDGGTFGRTNGYWKVMLITHDRELARDLCQSIENRTYDGYTPWEGYFSSLENVSVEGFVVC